MAGQDAELDGVGFEAGYPAAPVLVVEYADFACSACAEFALETWPEIERDFVDTGLVRWHFVPFELGFRNSEEGLRAAECAGRQNRFDAMHDALFARRSAWVDERRPDEALMSLAAHAGLDTFAFEACYEDGDLEDRTRSANRAARRDGVRGTPTFFVNGHRVQGALPIAEFRALLLTALQGSGAR